MNSSLHFAYNKNRAKTHVSKLKGPSYEFSELAVYFGVLPGQLRNAIRNAPTPPPKPSLTLGKREWYPLRDYKAWWDSLEVKDFNVLGAVKPKSILNH